MTGFSTAGAITYTYTGKPFINFFSATCPQRCGISGFFTLSAPLAPNLPLTNLVPLQFTFTDGLITIDSTNAATGPFGSSNFSVTTDALGAINGWNNSYFTATNFMFSSTNPPGCIGCSVTDQSGDYATTSFASVNDDSGSWSASQVPEPDPFLLSAFGAGLILLRHARRPRLPRSEQR